MSGCQAIGTATDGVATALRQVDCLAGEATAGAFGRLFGANGALLPALTILLTLYIGFLAVGLLTGRSRLNLSSLTPRMMTLGLVLTFATSWVAYQSVVWNLAVGAPDQIASLLMGTKGSATSLFAGRVDLIFGAIAEVADTAAPAAGAAQETASGSFTSADLLWISALMLLLGTVGVLVTAKIALAALLALGPVFVVMALFRGTRGLFEGWLKGAVMFAITPLFAVLIGGGVLELAVPVVQNLRNNSGADGIDGRAAVTLFLMAAVYIALMVMVMKTATTIVSGWRVFGGSAEAAAAGSAGQGSAASAVADAAQVQPLNRALANTAPERARAMAAVVAQPANDVAPAASTSISRTQLVTTQQTASAPEAPRTAAAPDRVRGIGSRFRAPPRTFQEKHS